MPPISPNLIFSLNRGDIDVDAFGNIPDDVGHLQIDRRDERLNTLFGFDVWLELE
jgi:hypothetical protein